MIKHFYAALCLMFCISNAAYTDQNLDEQIESTRVALQSQYLDFLRDPETAIFYNQTYLDLQELRVKRDLQNFENEAPAKKAKWQDEARGIEIKLKKDFLANIAQARTKINGLYRILRTPFDVSYLADKGQISLLQMQVDRPLGTISKVGTNPYARRYSTPKKKGC